MKTLQLISTVILMALTNTALSNNTLQSNFELSINVIEVVSPTCHYTPDGSLTVEAVGGQEPYTYDWNTFPNQTTQKAINLVAGIYFIEITDANGKKLFQSIELKGPDMDDGSIEMTDLKSTAPEIEFNKDKQYSYEFDNISTNETALNELPVGVYKVIVTNENNCSMIQYIQVVQAEKEDSDDGLGNENDQPSTITEITRLYPVKGSDNNSDRPEKDNLVTMSNNTK